MIKRYLVFVYDTHYPAGGWGDLGLQTDSLDDAKAFARKKDGEGLNVDLIDTHVSDGAELDWRRG